MARSALFYLVLAVVALSFAPQVLAFGAGNIPAYSYLEDKAFRHGDIEDVMANMYKVVGTGFLSRGTKFTGLDLKRVYFGNWLRDYSQAVDVAALSKVPFQTVLNVVMVLGFLAHGYVTEEFEVTKERLGCYLPTEHIDNPKGYAEGEDARKYDPRLRGPIDPRELEIDPQTGMKNYIANENGNWDTSKALVRRTLLKCIEVGRRAQQTGNKNDEYEAFRLFGTALHTLEDFTAHSNFCELALISMGNHQVFPHVGQNCRVRTPQGREVFPLVTGTFGGADFIHSLMGEAGDHLSSAAVSDLSKSFSDSRSIQDGQGASAQALRQMFVQMPGQDTDHLNREMDNLQNLRSTTADPSTMSPQELYKVLWQALAFRDKVMKSIENTIDRIPGLSSLTEKIGNSVSVFVMTTIEPYVKPLLGTATETLANSSHAILNAHANEQFEVWNNPNASDPTHSFLSKDHFDVLLNEPAGQIAQLIVKFSAERIAQAWSDSNIDPRQPVEDILQCLFHPDFSNGAEIQRIMLDHMHKWWQGQGKDQQASLQRLTAQAVREGRNKRIGDDSVSTGHVHNQMLPEGGLQQVIAQHNIQIPGFSGGQGNQGGKRDNNQRFQNAPSLDSLGGGGRSSGQSGFGGSGYGGNQSGFGGQQSGFGGQGYQQHDSGYGRQSPPQHGGYGRQSPPQHGGYGRQSPPQHQTGFQPHGSPGFQPQGGYQSGGGFQPQGGYGGPQHGSGFGRHSPQPPSGFQPQGQYGSFNPPSGPPPPGQGRHGSGFGGGYGGGGDGYPGNRW
ncbi:Het-C-domain-containing protein [Cutaneotrichosporon oleaginosum]|uniref:Het-C-domain-containing protein n=1 Tax=Cutaneotrichosporon oleaginosum TaxID=879819 RepID=A0A0J0XMS1_9TREE|nr:Het-C-domain-containing protein [Cutaneotrichosporon oleaginosum]KLT42390.1 Het-C-domain-containing protein [Cutaneotrichosporon oleaginosum]TXT04209.1 hypothetical protein COLE_07906 [Cutaneotrichosporon oleaginosum]